MLEHHRACLITKAVFPMVYKTILEIKTSIKTCGCHCFLDLDSITLLRLVVLVEIWHNDRIVNVVPSYKLLWDPGKLWLELTVAHKHFS